MKQCIALVLIAVCLGARAGSVTVGDVLDVDTSIAYEKEKRALDQLNGAAAPAVPGPTLVSGPAPEERHTVSNRVYAVYGVGDHLRGQMILNGIGSPEFGVGTQVGGYTVKSLSLSRAVLVDSHGKETVVPVLLGQTGDDSGAGGTVVSGDHQPRMMQPAPIAAPVGFPTAHRVDSSDFGRQPLSRPNPALLAPVATNPSNVAALSGGAGAGAVPPHPVQAFTPASLSTSQ